MNINIKYFDPSVMKKGAVVMVIGRRGSGKSTMCSDILSYQRSAKRGICISATERANPFWAAHIPKCFLYDEFDSDITKSLFKMQRKCKKELGYAEQSFAIYDDLMFNRNFIKDKTTKQVLFNGRHDNIFCLITTQYLTDVPPNIRSNVDYVIIMRDNIRNNREKVYTYFAGMFSTFAAFDEVMMACTQNHEALVIDQTCLSYDISDSVFFYKATPNLKYKVCSKIYWQSDQNNFKDSDDEEDVKIKKKIKVKKTYPKKSGSSSSSSNNKEDYRERYNKMLKRSRGF